MESSLAHQTPSNDVYVCLDMTRRAESQVDVWSLAAWDAKLQWTQSCNGRKAAMDAKLQWFTARMGHNGIVNQTYDRASHLTPRKSRYLQVWRLGEQLVGEYRYLVEAGPVTCACHLLTGRQLAVGRCDDRRLAPASTLFARVYLGAFAFLYLCCVSSPSPHPLPHHCRPPSHSPGCPGQHPQFPI
jgi:hypothetical protein